MTLSRRYATVVATPSAEERSRERRL